jgi:hypothetical protein
MDIENILAVLDRQQNNNDTVQDKDSQAHVPTKLHQETDGRTHRPVSQAARLHNAEPTAINTHSRGTPRAIK